MKEQVLAYIPVIDKLAEKRFPNSTLAIQASMFVLEKLEKNNWEKVRSFKGKSKFSTFLSATTRRLLEDFARSQFGRIRPPLWLQQLGGLWLEIFRYLCLDRYTVPETVESMVTSVPTRSRKEVEEAAQTILLKIHDCGSYHGTEFQAEDDELERAEYSRTGNSSQDDNMYKKDSAALFEIIFQTLLDDPQVLPSFNSLNERLSTLEISLSSTERLLLKMRFIEGMSISAACRTLNLKDYEGRKTLNNCLQTLRKLFTEAGLEEQIQEVLLYKDHTREFGMKKKTQKKSTCPS